MAKAPTTPRTTSTKSVAPTSSANTLGDAQAQIEAAANELRNAQKHFEQAQSRLTSATQAYENSVLNLNKVVEAVRTQTSVRPLGL